MNELTRAEKLSTVSTPGRHDCGFRSTTF